MNVWTEADQAELEVLLWVLADDWAKHRRTCRLQPCPHLIEAIVEVVDWRELRLLLSRAEALRAELEDVA